MPKIKILVAFHKPYTIIKNDILTPIHVGRDIAFEKSKDGIISNEEYDWLLKNCIGDNTGNNISNLNRYYCELTALWWAWKNYEALGNPDYIGLMHYRTYFDLLDNKIINNYFKSYKKGAGQEGYKYLYFTQDALELILKEYDAVVLNGVNLKVVLDEIPSYFTPECVKTYLVNGKWKNISQEIERFEKEHIFYSKNMFILKRSDFFEYCEFLFDNINSIKEKNKDNLMPRELGFHGEIISSLYFSYLKNIKKENVLETKLYSIPEKNVRKNGRVKYIFYKTLNNFIYLRRNNKSFKREVKYNLSNSIK